FRALRFKMILRFFKLQSRKLRQILDGLSGKTWVGINAGADSRSAQRKLSQHVLEFLQTPDSQLNLPRISSKLLSKAYRRRILQMRTTDCHDEIKFLSLSRERALEFFQRGDQSGLN